MRESDINKSWTVIRIVAGFCALLCTIFILFIIPGWIRNGFDLRNGFGLLSVSALLGGPWGSAVATAGLICCWLAFRGSRAESRQRIGYTLAGGLILGSIGFIAGFFGPLILTPTSNQGPLLGIFLTGPIGFVAGVFVGAVYALIRVGRSQSVQ